MSNLTFRLSRVRPRRRSVVSIRNIFAQIAVLRNKPNLGESREKLLISFEHSIEIADTVNSNSVI